MGLVVIPNANCDDNASSNVDSSAVIYNGADLTCLNITTGMTLNTVLNLLETQCTSVGNSITNIQSDITAIQGDITTINNTIAALASSDIAYDGAAAVNYTPTAGTGLNARFEGIDNALASLTSTIPLGTTIRFVSKAGNNGTALAGRLDKPYLTFAGANGAASTGDWIVAFPGTYSEADVFTDQMNYYLMPGVTISDSSATGVINLATIKRITVRGNGILKNTNAAGASCVGTGNSSSVLDIECDEIYGESYPVLLTAGTTRIKCNKIYGKLKATVTISSTATADIETSKGIYCDSANSTVTGPLAIDIPGATSGSTRIKSDVYVTGNTLKDYPLVGIGYTGAVSSTGKIEIIGNITDSRGAGATAPCALNIGNVSTRTEYTGNIWANNGNSSVILNSSTVDHNFKLTGSIVTTSPSATGILFSGTFSAASRADFTNVEIGQSGTDAATITIGSYGKAVFNHCRIANTNNGTASHGILVAGSPSKVVLNNTVTVITNGSAFDVAASAAKSVYVYQAITNVAAKDADITELINTVQRDTNVI